MINRRTFVQQLGAAAALPALGTSLGTLKKKPRLGVQLYSLRDAAKVNLEKTLEDIAGIGYTEVELLDSMGNFGMPAAKLRQVLDRVGLKAPSTHCDGRAFDNLAPHLDDAHTLGHQYFILASLPGNQRTLDDYRRWADKLNTAGEQSKKAGIWIGFHDEAYDFKPTDGKMPYDVLVERTDPKLVRLQLDTGNAAIGGVDPLTYLDKYHDRYFLFHVKDAARLGAEHDSELGTGVVDIKKLLKKIGKLDGKHLYVEQESYLGSGGALDSVRRDYQYLAKLVG